jgi:hypothetical protein
VSQKARRHAATRGGGRRRTSGSLDGRVSVTSNALVIARRSFGTPVSGGGRILERGSIAQRKLRLELRDAIPRDGGGPPGQLDGATHAPKRNGTFGERDDGGECSERRVAARTPRVRDEDVDGRRDQRQSMRAHGSTGSPSTRRAVVSDGSFGVRTRRGSLTKRPSAGTERVRPLDFSALRSSERTRGSTHARNGRVGDALARSLQ